MKTLTTFLLLFCMTLTLTQAQNRMFLENTGDVALGTFAAPGDEGPNQFGLNVQNYVGAKAAIRGADQSGVQLYAEGMLGVLSPGSLGIPLSVTNIGVLGIKPALGGNGAAVYGWNNDDNSTNYAGLFFTDGTQAFSTNYAVYAEAINGANNYAGWFNGRVDINGHASSIDSTANVLDVSVNHNRTFDTYAIYGRSVPAPGYGYGVTGEGGWRGVYGLANATTYTGFAYGVYGQATGSTAGTRIGVYGTAFGGTTNWAGYFAGDVYVTSDLRIATTIQAAGHALSVNGKIACEEVLVQDAGSWPDYVFADDYALMSLSEVERYIKSERHLPGVPSASEVEEEGLQLGDMQKRIMEKLEELTLYTINQEKEIQALKEHNTGQQIEIIALKGRLNQVEQENVLLKKQ